MFLFEFHLPLSEAVPVFTLMMLIILLAPMIFKHLRLPGMVVHTHRGNPVSTRITTQRPLRSLDEAQMRRN